MVRMLAFMPVAAPVCPAGTLPTIRLAMEAKARPMPRPKTPDTKAICHCSSCQSARKPQATAPSAAPVVSSFFAPSTGSSRPLRMPETNIAISIGSMSSPDAVTLAPNPYPAELGVWTKPGRKDQIEYMPAPNSSAAVLVVHTAGSRMTRRSISGERDRDSDSSHSAKSTTAAANSPITRAEPQPHWPAWLSGSSSATSHADSRTAPSQLTRPSARLGDSGTYRRAMSVVTATMPTGSQNSQR
jgi:hypothetical protein